MAGVAQKALLPLQGMAQIRQIAVELPGQFIDLAELKIGQGGGQPGRGKFPGPLIQPLHGLIESFEHIAHRQKNDQNHGHTNGKGDQKKQLQPGIAGQFIGFRPIGLHQVKGLSVVEGIGQK